MVKKQKINEVQQSNKIKHIKSNKVKNKEMFTELKTHEENKIHKSNRIKISNLKNQQMINQDDSNSYENNIQLTNQKQNNNIQQVCAIVHNLITKNKISAKNAFEVPFIDLQKLQDFSRISQSQNGWRKISSTLQNDSKIYSFRVDAIHSIAYKIMNTMTRNQDEEVSNKQGEVPQQMKKQNQIDKIAFPIVDQFDVSIGIQLEKNIQNINMQSLDKYASFNPTYERTRRRFDQNGLKGMLLNNIQMDNNLQLSLNQTRKFRSNGFYSQAIPVKVDKLTENLNIFKTVENTRKAVSDLTQQQFIYPNGIQQSWRKIFHGQLACQKVNPQNNDNQMEEEIPQQKIEPYLKKVQDAIKLKNKTKLALKSANDVAQDGFTWLSQMDRKFLGLNVSTATNNTTTLKRGSSNKIQKNEDDIDFGIEKIQKHYVFSEQTLERQKQQYNQQIEEKHLLPIRLFHKFKVEQIMTLREQPPQNFIIKQNYQINQEEIEKQIQRQQVDIKRQQMSIRQSKQKLKSILLKQTDFKGLCKKFQIAQRNIGPQLCFLTVLHLANENNLRLEQIDDFNFKISS